MADKLKFNDEAIREVFRRYVESFEDQERHSPQAVRYAEEFDDFCSRHISGNALTKIEAYTRMTDTAVEFEEGGFIAGFKAAMNILLSEDEAAGLETVPEKAKEQAEGTQATIPTPKAEKSLHEPANDSQKDSRQDDCFITSLQIAELFGNPNWKVVKRIDDRIVPYLDAESKAMFRKETANNVQNKPVVYYRLNQAACMMYLDLMEPKRAQFISIAGGYAKLQELMKNTFRTEAVPLPA